jgi:hypothetical protein
VGVLGIGIDHGFGRAEVADAGMTSWLTLHDESSNVFADALLLVACLSPRAVFDYRNRHDFGYAAPCIHVHVRSGRSDGYAAGRHPAMGSQTWAFPVESSQRLSSGPSFLALALSTSPDRHIHGLHWRRTPHLRVHHMAAAYQTWGTVEHFNGSAYGPSVFIWCMNPSLSLSASRGM